MTPTLLKFTRNAGDVIAEIAMTRTAFIGAVVLVEGPTDSRFVSRHLNTALAQVVICGGKQVVLAAVSGLSAVGLSGCVGMIDLDFDHYFRPTSLPNVVVTDTHDIETLLLSVRLQIILGEYGDKDKIEAAAAGHDLADALIARAAVFARLRYLNEVAPQFGIAFDSFSPWKYIDVTTWTLDESRLHSDFASTCKIAASDLPAMLATVPNLQTWRDVQGHDSLAILSIGFRQALGSGKQVSEAGLLTALRLAFSESDFLATQLYASFKSWESSPDGLPLFV